jgi:hypothetical protein
MSCDLLASLSDFNPLFSSPNLNHEPRLESWQIRYLTTNLSLNEIVIDVKNCITSVRTQVGVDFQASNHWDLGHSHTLKCHISFTKLFRISLYFIKKIRVFQTLYCKFHSNILNLFDICNITFHIITHFMKSSASFINIVHKPNKSKIFYIITTNNGF